MSQNSQYSSQIVCTQDISTCSEWEDEIMEPVDCWATLVSLRNSSNRFFCEEDQEYSIGRDNRASFIINLHYISKIHCGIYKDKGLVFIRDYSSNGTYIGRNKTIKKIGKGNTAILRNGDKIILTKTNKQYNVDEISFTFIQEIEDKGITEYTLGDKLGSGAFATVYRGIHKETFNQVAIKVINKKKISDRNVVLEEVNILQRINHPGVVGIETLHETDSDFYLILELVTGGELFDLLRDKGFLKENETRYYMKQILETIQYLHANGIVHRDLKLENILLKDKTRKHIKISDFGLSRIVGKGVFMKTVCGTPEYLAPEILSGNTSCGYSNAVDMWAIGVIMYTLLCGYSPFEPENNGSVFQKVSVGDFTFPKDVTLSYEAKHLICKLLTKDPSKRISAENAQRHPWIRNSKIKRTK